MRLPEGAKYHFQMQYGSIGWATGATLGVALGVGESLKFYLIPSNLSFNDLVIITFVTLLNLFLSRNFYCK